MPAPAADVPKRVRTDPGRLLVWLVAIVTTAALLHAWSERSRPPVPPDPAALAARLTPVGAVRRAPPAPPGLPENRGPVTAAAATPVPAVEPEPTLTQPPPPAETVVSTPEPTTPAPVSGGRRPAA